MLFRLSTDSPEPIYQQLIRQLHAAIVSGRLKPGDRIPSHRELAAELVINHLTIKRAFDELEREGLIETRRGVGSFVPMRLPKRIASHGHDDVASTLKRNAQHARELGLTEADWQRLAQAAWKDTQ